VILFWYSLLAVLIGLLTAFEERNAFGLVFGAVMVAIWSCSAYACKRWLNRLRAEERGGSELVNDFETPAGII
jgi:hypothetical protein